MLYEVVSFKLEPVSYTFIKYMQVWKKNVHGFPYKNPLIHKNVYVYLKLFFLPPLLGVGGIKFYLCQYIPHLVSAR
jgi:hypothetical protein